MRPRVTRGGASEMLGAFARMLIISCILLPSARAQSLPPYPTSWKLLYQSNFASGSLSDWTMIMNPNLNGTWSIVPDGANWALEGANNARIELVQRQFSNFLAHFRLRVASGGGLTIFFRWQYCSGESIGMGEGVVAVARYDACTANPDFQAYGPNGSGLIAGNWSNVDILVNGATTKVYVDGTLRLDASDPNPLAVGGFDLGTGSSATVDLENLQVYGPPQDNVASILTWTKTGGPPGGVGYDVRFRMDQPSRMYATDVSSGVNVSDDNGLTWHSSNNGILTRAGSSNDAIPIFTLTIDPHNPNIVWAGTRFSRGLYKSTDAGTTWTPKTRGIVEDPITFRGVTIDPNNESVTYVAAEIPSLAYAGQNLMGLRFALSKGAVYRSSDGGENWTAVWHGDALARYVWIDPRNSNVIYVSTGFFDVEPANADPTNLKPGGVGILKTIDGGTTWTALNEKNGLSDLYLGTLAMNPQNPDVLLAGSVDNNYPNVVSGVFVTFDGGTTWTRGVFANGGSPAGMWNAVTYASSDPTIAYAAGPDTFMRSTDMGKTWTIMAGGGGGRSYGPPGLLPNVPVALAVDPRNANRVFQNNYTGGNFLTEDGGVTWQLASQGYVGSQIAAVASDPTTPGRVYSGGRPGIFRSDDGGGTWLGQNHQSNPDQYLGTPIAFAADPTHPGTVLIADESLGSIYRSTDAGTTRQLVFLQPGLYTSADFANRFGFHAIAYAPSNPYTVFAGMRYYLADNDVFRTSYGVAKSIDGGLTWAYANDANIAGHNVSALAVHPCDDQTAYAGTVESGVMVTHNGGQAWTASSHGLPSADVRALVIDPSNPILIYAGLENGGVWKSTNGGASWNFAGAGIDAQTSVRSLVIDPTYPDILYAGTPNGVYRTGDAAGLWVPITRALSIRAVNSLSISGDGRTVWAATDGGGVFRLIDTCGVGTVACGGRVLKSPAAPVCWLYQQPPTLNRNTRGPSGGQSRR